MQPIRIYPQYAIILTYDIKPGVHEHYFRWVTNDFLPAMQNRKLYMQHAWHVVGDNGQPERQIEFITEELDIIKRLIKDPSWKHLEDRLQTFTQNYTFRVVKYNGSFKI